MFRELWRKVRCTFIVDCFLEEIDNLEYAILRKYGYEQGRKILNKCMDQMISKKETIHCKDETCYAFDLKIYKECLEKVVRN